MTATKSVSAWKSLVRVLGALEFEVQNSIDTNSRVYIYLSHWTSEDEGQSLGDFEENLLRILRKWIDPEASSTRAVRRSKLSFDPSTTFSIKILRERLWDPSIVDRLAYYGEYLSWLVETERKRDIVRRMTGTGNEKYLKNIEWPKEPPCPQGVEKLDESTLKWLATSFGVAI